MDFPGYYIRRLHSVSVSIPAVTSPYTSINATLTLLESKYRVRTGPITGPEYKDAGSKADNFRTDRIPVTSIALSSGSLDTGVFELNFSGPNYMPFEGAGAISKWSLELPTEVRKFDYDSIGDVLLHVQYTALEGGACLKAAANDSVNRTLRAIEVQGQDAGFWAMWDLKNDFPTEWHSFSSKLSAAAVTGDEAITFTFPDMKKQLPYWPRRQDKLRVCTAGLICRDKALLTSLDLSIASSAAGKTWTPKSLGSPATGAAAMRTCSSLTHEDWTDWTLGTKGKALKKGTTLVDAVYLLVQYIYI